MPTININLSGVKNLSHGAAAVIGSVAAYLIANPDQAKALWVFAAGHSWQALVVTAATIIVAIYHNPKTPAAPTAPQAKS